VNKKYLQLHRLDNQDKKEGILNRIKNNIFKVKIKLLIKAYLNLKIAGWTSFRCFKSL